MADDDGCGSFYTVHRFLSFTYFCVEILYISVFILYNDAILCHEKGRLPVRIRWRMLAALLLITCLPAIGALPVSAITPTYTLSDEYMTSAYYTALTELTLTGDERYDVLAVAFTQLGYHEGDGEPDFDGHKTDGSRNFAEYNRMYGKLDNGEGNGMSYGYSWCAAFVSWCLRQSRVEETAAITEVSCRRMTDWYREQGRFYSRQSGYTPLPGDIIMFHDGDGVPSHVGFVLGVEQGRVHVIDGNGREDSVAVHVYHHNSRAIYGYCVPDYHVLPGTVYEFVPHTPISIGAVITLSSVAAVVIVAVGGLAAAVLMRTHRAALAIARQEDDERS